MPSRRAASRDRSITRPLTKGPRSLIRTITERPVRRTVTRTMVPNGSVLCAAVMAPGLNRSPEAVILWREHSPGCRQSYQEAMPVRACAAAGAASRPSTSAAQRTRKSIRRATSGGSEQVAAMGSSGAEGSAAGA